MKYICSTCKFASNDKQVYNNHFFSKFHQEAVLSQWIHHLPNVVHVKKKKNHYDVDYGFTNGLKVVSIKENAYSVVRLGLIFGILMVIEWHLNKDVV